MVYEFFDKQSKGSGRPLFSNNEIKENIQLAKYCNLKKEKCILHLEIMFGVQI